MTGDTSRQPVTQQYVTVGDQIQTVFYGGDRIAFLQFEVLEAGNITFDACESLHATALEIFEGWGSTATSNYDALIGFDLFPDKVGINSTMMSAVLDFRLHKTAWIGGCLNSQSVLRTTYLSAGRYTLATRGQYWRVHNGIYVIKMTCSDGAVTRSVADNDPGGLLVDPKTGAISGTPQKAGENYTMELQAVDAARQVATVASWRFSVREREFATSSLWTVANDYDAARNIVPRYHANELHTISPPSINRTALFVNPSDQHFDSIVFLLLVNGTACNEDGVSAFVNVVTGSAVFNVPCPGNFSATLKARDDAGFEALVNHWDFEARVPDTTVPAFGPNGRECTRGVAVDGVPMDGSFTCDCNDTAFGGANCDEALASSSTQNSEDSTGSRAAIIAAAAVVAVVLIALAVSRYQLYREQHRPQDVGAFQDEVLGNIGGTLAVRKGEEGFMLQFASPVNDSQNSTMFESIVLAAVLDNVPRFRRQSLKDAVVRFAPPLPYALVTIPHKLKPGEIEKLVTGLSLQAAKGKLTACELKVIDVTTAMAKNLPSELDRKRITRIEQLGAGYYGEVRRAS